jgi:anthranilate synthase/aminodeoxychorismate synthase-like glutamine amidotransferase
MKQNPTILLIDNYDSFTYNLYDYFCQLGAACKVVRNDELHLSDIQSHSFDALVLSPGPGRPESAGIMMDLLEDFCHRKVILGICLGMQAIGLHFGAKLVHAKEPVHGKTSKIFHRQDNVFCEVPNPALVMRYHSLVIKDLPSCLDVTAWTKDNTIMAIQHTELPIYGFQFHPESILTQEGMLLLKNWLKTCL